MAKDEMKYEQAVRELEQIVERMENDELDIDQLSEQLKRAKTLVNFQLTGKIQSFCPYRASC